ncbi:MAG: hypothetical protein WCV81_04970 [Microgenomates group bacterium]|jgi:glutaredoxin
MKSWHIVIAVIIVLSGLIFFLSKSTNSSNKATLNPNALTYFWSITCPHCKNVADFLNTWPNTDKLNLDKKEISEDRTNQVLFTEAGKKCNIPSDQMGVPLLITPDNKCISGDQPVIEYFKSLFPDASISATPTQ